MQYNELRQYLYGECKFFSNVVYLKNLYNKTKMNSMINVAKYNYIVFV